MMITKSKKCISIILILTIFLTLIPSLPVFAAAVHYENRGMEFCDDTPAGEAKYQEIKNSLPKMANGAIPPKIHPTVISTKLYINYRLWSQKGILVYGNYSKVPKNDFKQGTQPSTGVVDKNEGYYSSDNVRGEYRYHGYDITGNLFSNMNLVDDASGTKFNERDWIKMPWDNLPLDKRPKESEYNKAADNKRPYTDPTIQPKTIEWINKTLAAYNGVPKKGGILDPNVYNYLNILSAPTTKRMGQGRMWHDVNGSEPGGIWYQTLSVPTTTDKLNPPVETAIYLPKAVSLKDIGPSMDAQTIEIKFMVQATLKDENIYNDAVKKAVYYTREDLKTWDLTFTYPDPTTQGKTSDTITVPKTGNKSKTETFMVKTTYGFLRQHDWKIPVHASAIPLYNDDKHGMRDDDSKDFDITVVKDPPVPTVTTYPWTPRNNIPEMAFEGVPFTATDNSDMSKVIDRKVFVDGEQVDDTEFFSGNYIFEGEVGENGRFAAVEIDYDVEGIELENGDKIKSLDYVYIYPTKPIANFKITSNTWKQNRLITINDTSAAGNIQLVVQRYPITEYRWSFGGDTTQLRKGTDTDTLKQLLYKQPGIYTVTLEVKNSLGRWSDPYTVEFEVLEDYAPAIGCNLTDSVTNRNEEIGAWFYEAVSTDGDSIESSSIELWYDSDNNGTVDTKLNTWNNVTEFPSYKPTRLGYYKYIISAKENIIGDTLPACITESDKKTSTYEVEFWCDNFRPMSDLYVNIPIARPNIDVYFMLDKNLDQTKRDYMLSNRMNIANWLIGRNIIPNVNIWDMKTYTYSQPASTSSHTGSSYPSSSISYSSNGYSGTLGLSSISNNRYSVDYGYTAYRTETKTATAGGQSVSGHGASSLYPPSSVSYSDGGGYSGTLSAYGYSYSSTPCGHSKTNVGPGGCTEGLYYWTRSYAGYSGTVSRTVPYWVPNIVWYNDYTGYYTGTIYKDVRQSYADPFNPTSLKYVIYLSDSTISELSDLQKVMGYAKNAKLILAGTSGIKSQIAGSCYFDVTGKGIDKVTNEILEYISESSPAVERYYVLQNQAFAMNVGSLDLENDAIVEAGMQYVHEPDYFDNPTGTESGTVSTYSDTSGWTSTIKSSFANTGKYTIYRHVRDNPSSDPNFSQYSYYSSPTMLEIFVHRKPIALATLDWDYNASSGTYKTTWVDESYDPDHQYSRADKGIIERNIMWRMTGGQWNYGIPDNLSPGTYELRYFVKDPEETWSDPFTMNFTLSTAPPMQFRASLRTFDGSFSLESIPASEYLEAFYLWTRYPYNVRLEMSLYNGAARVSPLTTVNFSVATGAKDGNDISWNNIKYNIPATLPDSTYTCMISAIGDYSQTASKSFTVKVVTPVDLKPVVPEKVVNGATSALSAETSKYVNSTKVAMYYGTAYQTTFDMSSNLSGEKKNWSASVLIPDGIPEGTYTARFQASTPNGNVEYKNIPFTVESFRITGVTLEGSWNHWRGQTDLLGNLLTNEPHRFLSLENVKVNVYTTGYVDKVVIRFSPQLEAMEFTDSKGNLYKYSDYLGYNVAFPSDSTIVLDNSKRDNHAVWEYSLPLAPSTKSWTNERLRPQYSMTVTVYKGASSLNYVIDDIDITGNIYDLTYIQPLN